MATPTDTAITVAVAPDRMSAVLRIAGQSDTTQITPEHLAEAVRGARIEWLDDQWARLDEWVEGALTAADPGTDA